MVRLLTTAQMQRLRANILLRHQAYLVSVLGDDAVPPKVLRAIRRAGLYRAAGLDPIRTPYLLGRAAVRDARVLEMKLPALQRYLRARQLPLTPADRKALGAAHRGLQGYLEKLGPKLEQKVAEAVDATHRALRAALKIGETPERARQAATRYLVDQMGAITRQQLQAAKQILDTETNNAYQLGRSHEVAAQAKGGDPWVFKRPRPDCCTACRDAYLEKDGKTPRLFRLSALTANGSNVGRARPERLAAVGAIHPHCRCELSVLPEGFRFDSTGTMRFVGTSRAAHG